MLSIRHGEAAEKAWLINRAIWIRRTHLKSEVTESECYGVEERHLPVFGLPGFAGRRKLPCNVWKQFRHVRRHLLLRDDAGFLKELCERLLTDPSDRRFGNTSFRGNFPHELGVTRSISLAVGW